MTTKEKIIQEIEPLTEPLLAEVLEFVLSLKAKHEYKLEALLAGVTPANLHSEIDTGTPVGREDCW